tara:strand:- start:383 stop:649 length:267 start_codon:yes stop_codon:yes gene_type:complete
MKKDTKPQKTLRSRIAYKWWCIKYDLNQMLNREKDMASAKNYTDEMVSTMTEQYSANPTRETVDALAENNLAKLQEVLLLNFQERECM